MHASGDRADGAFTGVTLRIETASDTLRYEYGAKGERVYKAFDADGLKRVYLCVGSGSLLVQLKPGETTLHVYDAIRNLTALTRKGARRAAG